MYLCPKKSGALKITFTVVQTYFAHALINLGIWIRNYSFKFNQFRERRRNRMHLKLNIEWVNPGLRKIEIFIIDYFGNTFFGWFLHNTILGNPIT